MADVTHDGDRAQLVLITGVVIAVVLVAMVLLLNAVIYTENLATRSVGDDAGDALEYRAVVVGSVGGLIDAENTREYETYADLEANVSAGAKTVDDRLAAKHAERGAIAIADVENATYTEGMLLRQNETGPFTSDGTDTGDANWTLVDNVTNTRGYVMELDAENVSSVSDPTNAFQIHVDDGNRSWIAYVYEDSGKIVVEAEPPGGSREEVCPRVNATGTVALDLTGGTIDGEVCRGLDWPTTLDPYEIRYANGDGAAGTYDLTVDTTASDPTDDLESIDELVDLGGDSNVYAVPAVYSATVDVEYRSSEVRFETQVRIARGEPDG